MKNNLKKMLAVLAVAGMILSPSAFAAKNIRRVHDGSARVVWTKPAPARCRSGPCY